MHVNSKFIYLAIVCLLVLVACRRPLTVQQVQELPEYASGSGMAFFNNRIYLMGDDMSYLLVTDTSFQPIDSIRLLNSTQSRIPKEVKQDIEAISLLRLKKNPSLLLIGSGSIEPYRSKGWLIDIRNKTGKLIEMESFYRRLTAFGIKEKNIEGVTAFSAGIVLANRGNKSYPKNYLVFTNHEFWNNQSTADIRIMKVGANTDTAAFSGVSGLEYSFRSDCLLLTISTENTYSAKSDGAIGKSYLWLINNITTKRRLTAINPDRVIDLEAMDNRFKGHKIESVCIIGEDKSDYHLVLVADNDKGTSVLFKLLLKKKK
jgi:hypothetical protein